MNGLLSVGYFLFDLMFSILTFLLWFRIALRYFRISALHPVSQTIFSLTNPIIDPIEHLVSKKKNRINRYDWVAFGVLVAVQILKFSLLGLLFSRGLMPIAYIIVYAIAELITQPCNLLFYAILIRVIMSWVNPAWNHPINDVLRLITEPLLRVARRIIPNASVFDFSPIVVLLLLQIITLFVHGVAPPLFR